MTSATNPLERDIRNSIHCCGRAHGHGRGQHALSQRHARAGRWRMGRPGGGCAACGP
ncbi:MAG: hypothetical protein R3A10_23520 [Caldilineaceae bacterium]